MVLFVSFFKAYRTFARSGLFFRIHRKKLVVGCFPFHALEGWTKEHRVAHRHARIVRSPRFALAILTHFGEELVFPSLQINHGEAFLTLGDLLRFSINPELQLLGGCVREGVHIQRKPDLPGFVRSQDAMEVVGAGALTSRMMMLKEVQAALER